MKSTAFSIVWLFAALTFGACKSEPSAAGAAPPDTDRAPSQPAAAKESPPELTEPSRVPVKEHMQEHFAAITAIQRAVVRGDMETVHERAGWLVNHDTPAGLVEAEAHIKRVKDAAGKLVAASSVEEAATLTAALGNECGACHVARHAITSFAWTPAPAATGTLKERMQLHQWASERLWEGLVGPSDELWNDGAAQLATAGFALPDDRRTPRAEEIAVQARDAVRKARDATTREERTQAIGTLLSTCAACHQETRVTPGPETIPDAPK